MALNMSRPCSNAGRMLGRKKIYITHYEPVMSVCLSACSFPSTAEPFSIPWDLTILVSSLKFLLPPLAWKLLFLLFQAHLSILASSFLFFAYQRNFYWRKYYGFFQKSQYFHQRKLYRFGHMQNIANCPLQVFHRLEKWRNFLLCFFAYLYICK